MQLRLDGNRSPQAVTVEVSRKLVESWGLNPWVFWYERRMEPVAYFAVDLRVWLAMWHSTDDEFPKMKEAYRQARKSVAWEKLLAARCHRSWLRYSWIRQHVLDTASQYATDNDAVINAQKFDSDFAVFGEIDQQRPLHSQAGFLDVINCVKDACPAQKVSPTQLICATREFKLEEITKYCWKMPIVQTLATAGRTWITKEAYSEIMSGE